MITLKRRLVRHQGLNAVISQLLAQVLQDKAGLQMAEVGPLLSFLSLYKNPIYHFNCKCIVKHFSLQF